MSAVRVSIASDDPSAGAWIGFLPFLLPIFLIQSAYIPIAAMIGEVVVAVYRWFRK